MYCLKGNVGGLYEFDEGVEKNENNLCTTVASYDEV